MGEAKSPPKSDGCVLAPFCSCQAVCLISGEILQHTVYSPVSAASIYLVQVRLN